MKGAWAEPLFFTKALSHIHIPPKCAIIAKFIRFLGNIKSLSYFYKTNRKATIYGKKIIIAR